MSACIYLIHYILNPEKYYIGSSINFSRRKKEHIKGLEKQKHHCKHLQSAYKKYGKETFKFYILEYVKDLSKLLDREDYYLQDYFDFDDELYNECFVAGSRLFYKQSYKMAKNQSLRMLGNTISKGKPAWNKGLTKSIDKRIAAYSQKIKGRKRSEEHCIHLSQSLKGHIPWNKNKKRPPFSKEWKRNMSIGQLKRHNHSELNKACSSVRRATNPGNTTPPALHHFGNSKAAAV